MKKIILFILLNILVLTNINAQKKSPQQAIDKPSEGKALIYIIRSSDVVFLVNFRMYHNNQFIGKLPYGKYLKKEVDPGENLFWVAAENRDYIKANVEEGKTYFINAMGKMGILSVQANYIPMNPKIKKHKKWIHKVIKKHELITYTDDELLEDDKSENITKGLDKYEVLKEKESNKVMELTPDMNFENANKP